MIREHKEKRVFSIDKIKAELVSIEDALSDWAKNSADRIFQGNGGQQGDHAFRDMVSWVQGEQQFTEPAKSDLPRRRTAG